MGDFFITSFILALATSLPELFVGITSALEGSPALSLGNIIGSNITNLSLIMGGTAIVGGGLAVRGNFLRRDVFYAFLAGAAPMLLLYDRSLSRIDAVILLALYVFYNISVFSERMKDLAEETGKQEKFVTKLIRKLNYNVPSRQLKEIGWVFLGVALLLFSADVLVKIAIKIAYGLNLSLLLIGLFLVSLGTTLPELVFGIKAVRQRKNSMVFGNLLGSIVANGTLIIGVASLISPFKVKAFSDYLLATMVYVIVFGLFYLFIHSKRKLEKWEGAVLIGVYLLFLLVEFFR